MKRQLISIVSLVSLVSLVALPATAQKTDDSYHSGFTLFGGITSYTIDVTPASTVAPGNASGFTGGIGMITHLGGPIGLEFDAAYVQGGYSGTVGVNTLTVHDNNVAGAVTLRPAFGSGPVRFFLQGGGSVAYLINCSETETGVTSPTCKVDSSQNRTDYGVLIGAGASYGMLALQVRYHIGLNNLTTTSGETVKSKGLLVIASLIL
jgi:hypothetical protein